MDQVKIAKAVLEMKTMQLIDDSVEYIFRSLGLENYYEFFKAENSSHHLPYHNEYHSMCMVLNCYEGAMHENINDLNDLRPLLVAALFHDFDHSGGELTDDLNIRRALNGFDRAFFSIRDLNLEEYHKTVDTLKITKYPYDGPPITMLQKIIRDADLMQIYEISERRLCKQFRGLKEEVEALHDRQYSSSEWAAGCLDFNQRVVWNTNWAKRKAILRDHSACTAKLTKLLLEYK